MKLTSDILKRKLATAVLIGASLAAFAALGDGGNKSSNPKDAFSSKFVITNIKPFSLKSCYNYRGSSIFNTPSHDSKFIMLNTVITYQKGNTTYILPLKKKVWLDKINFHPAP